MKKIISTLTVFGIFSLFTLGAHAQDSEIRRILTGKVYLNETQANGGDVVAKFKISVPLSSSGMVPVSNNNEGDPVVDDAQLEGVSINNVSYNNAQVKVVNRHSAETPYDIYITQDGNTLLRANWISEAFEDEDQGGRYHMSTDQFYVQGYGWFEQNDSGNDYTLYITQEDQIQ